MKRQFMIPFIFIILCLLTLASCVNKIEYLHIEKAGMLLEGTVHDSIWNESGYKGLLLIGEEFDMDVYTKENIETKQDAIKAVDELVYNGVNLIFGHGHHYGKYFVDIALDYPDVQFVYFNGGIFKKGVTGLNFNLHASGFFSGMIAGKMTRTNQVGVIAAYEWQAEIEGFYEGVKYQNPGSQVHVQFMNNWSDAEVALNIYHQMQERGVDVFYPIGDAFSTEIIEAAQEDQVYAFGYMDDQSEEYPETVLTSTVQHVDQLYLFAARKFNEKDLTDGFLTFDFQDRALSFGSFNQDLPLGFRLKFNQFVDNYIKTGMLPYEY